VEEIGPVMQGDILAGKTQIEPFRMTFQHVADNADLYRIILGGQGGAAIAQRIQSYLAATVMKSFRAAPAQAFSMPTDVIANFLAGAELSLIAWWLNSGQPYPPDEMARMAQRLILRGVLDVVDTTTTSQPK
jgi:hypothetical protein